MSKFEFDKEISLPPGYEPVDVEAVKQRRVPLEQVRHLHDKLYYLFNPDDADYKECLNKCKQDTKKLEKALQWELDKRGLHVWIRRKKRPAHRRNDSKISILIRPPFLNSFESELEKRNSRMQKDDRVDNYVLHIDADHQLQMVRNWGAETDDPWRESQIQSRRSKLGATLELYLQGMESMYGDWEAVAKKIADAIEKPLTRREIQVQLDS